MLRRSMVRHQVHQYPQPAITGLAEQRLQVVQGSEAGADSPVVGHVVAVVGERRRVDRAQPDDGNAQVGREVTPGRSPQPSPLLSWNDGTYT